MPRRTLATALALSVTALGSVLVSGPAEAAGPIQFGRAQYDSPGADTSSNASINAEYIVIRNTGTRAVSLTGWTVRDALPATYKFGTFTLGAGKTVVLRTGKGTNSATTRYWGMSRYVWNNTGDKALLRNAAGTAVDTCGWTKVGVGYVNCP